MQNNARVVAAHWPTLTSLAPHERPISYHGKLRDGTDRPPTPARRW